jgi:hypothetical protein
MLRNLSCWHGLAAIPVIRGCGDGSRRTDMRHLKGLINPEEGVVDAETSVRQHVCRYRAKQRSFFRDGCTMARGLSLRSTTLSLLSIPGVQTSARRPVAKNGFVCISLAHLARPVFRTDKSWFV